MNNEGDELEVSFNELINEAMWPWRCVCMFFSIKFHSILINIKPFNFNISSCVSYGKLYFVVLVVQLLSCIWLFAPPWTVAHQASLSFTVSQSLLRLLSIESVRPSNYLILCHPLLLLPSIVPSIRVFSNQKVFIHFTFICHFISIKC